MPISALPTPPSRSDAPQDFSDRADALLGALPSFVTEANALQSDVNAKEASVSSYATIATNKAAEAQGHATTANTKASEAAASAVAAAAAASNAEIAFDSFDDKYLGSKSADPATDNDGNPLLTGALYWNTSVGAVRVWNGSSWLSMAADASIVDFQQAGAGAVLRTAQDKLREWVSVKDFGLIGDGTDETSKLLSAIKYASDNRMDLYFPDGLVYGITNLYALYGGGYFSWTGNPRFKQVASRNPALNALEIGGASAATTVLSTTSAAGAFTVTVASADGIQVGDLIRLVTSRLMYGDHRFDGNNAFSQLSKVVKIAGNTITLSDPLTFDLNVGMIATGTAQAGSSGTITLAASSTVTEAQIKNYLLRIVSGTGVGQSKYIHTYNPTTKVVDIHPGAQGIWATVPDATSVYEIAAVTTVLVYRPAVVKNFGIELEGYAENSVAVQGVQVSFCDSPLIAGARISGCSRKALYTYRCYKAKVVNCSFSGANECTAGGNGLGYGHVDVGGYATQVSNCSASNCRTGFDATGGSLFLLRSNNTVTGGGSTYDGNLFWPATANYTNSGISSHTGAFALSDIGNTTVNVSSNKQRGSHQVVKDNVVLGYCDTGFAASYTDRVTYIGNIYESGVTVTPSAGLTGLPTFTPNATVPNRPIALIGVRYDTLLPDSDVIVRGNVANGITESLVYLTDVSLTPPRTFYEVVNNSVNVAATSKLTLSVVKAEVGTLAFRGFKVYDNKLSVGGAIGDIVADNIRKYSVLDSLDTSLNTVIDLGENKWLCCVNDDAAVAIDVGTGQTISQFVVYEKSALVANHFSGLVTRGTSTPIATYSISGVQFRNEVLTGTVGLDGSLNVALRNPTVDGRVFIENRTGAYCQFVVTMQDFLT